jgi:hypothetical protein
MVSAELNEALNQSQSDEGAITSATDSALGIEEMVRMGILFRSLKRRYYI